MKRLSDLIIASAILILLSPLLLLITFLVWMESGLPIYVRETRYGKRTCPDGDLKASIQKFDLFHFRTAADADPNVPRLLDQRITRVGYLLQKFSLDSLPEFVNVLRGDMSLIGPRPIRPETLDDVPIPDLYLARFDMRPGILGWWQVTRGDIGTRTAMFEADLYYIRNYSFRLDMKILLLLIGSLGRRANHQHWVPQSLVKVRENPLYNLIKRQMDIFLSLFALILVSPVLLIVALIVRLDSPGPVIYRQNRAGRRIFVLSGQAPILVTTQFTMYKFRTMYHNPQANDQAHKQWVQNWASGALTDGSDKEKVVKPKHDPRVTRVGRILRATSLDELPQLLNVLKGDMSLVGPRPVPVYETEVYQSEHYQRLDAVPGITGWWQINLRGRGTLDQMVELDVEYVKRKSIWMDLKILFLTVPAVLVGRGAK